MCDKGRKWSAAFRCCRQVDLKRHLESKDFPFLHPYPLHVLKGCVNRVRHPTWTWKFSSISAFIWTTLSFFCSAMASIPCHLHYSLPFSLRASQVFCLAVAWQPPPQASLTQGPVQGTAIRRFPGLVNFVFCVALPAAFTQPGDHLLAEPCNCWVKFELLKLPHVQCHA